jgi:S-adenosylmethionine:tRNA ribosyltransferase-isomerase
MFRLEDYDYELPAERIAQMPAYQRDHSRLLLLDRPTKVIKDYHFYDLPDLLLPGDSLVVNDTRVVPARLFGRKESGGRIEALVIQDGGTQERETRNRLCLLKSSKRPKVGSFLFFQGGISGKVRRLFDNGTALIAFGGEKPIEDLLRESGRMPVPPYIRREDESCESLDRRRYQTVYSKSEGAVAAPTAGLHFTVELLEKLKKKGIGVFPVTLHVGYGTFQPVRTADIREHKLVPELYRIDSAVSRAIGMCKASGGRVIAVGTTVVRTLESAAMKDGLVKPGEGKTDLMVTPGFPFKVVDALITNFHLPKSSLLFLVVAFAGLDSIRRAYSLAIERKYRFYSYGDAMLIL